MHVLLVEDDAAIVRALTELLEGERFDVTQTDIQSGALRLLQEGHFDIALLDVTLKEGNGFAVCAGAQKIDPNMPVIFLTASDDEYSTVAGLDMGATDYISKPFRARELISRIRRALRNASKTDDILCAGDVKLNATSAQVKKGDQEVFLSALEYRLLLYFLQNKNRLITRENVKDAIWDAAGEYVSDNAINVYIKRLRKKIETDPACPTIITTVRGLGYKVAD